MFLSRCCMSSRICCARWFVWWYPSCCMVGPQIAFSCCCAVVKCVFNLVQILSVVRRFFQSPKAFSKSLVFQITVSPMSSIWFSVYAMLAASAILRHFSIGLYRIIIGSAGLNSVILSSVLFCFTSSDGTFPYALKTNCSTVGMSLCINCVYSSTIDSRYLSYIIVLIGK